jgi:hypothetical protein
VNFARSTNGALAFTTIPISPASTADTTHAFPVVSSAGNGTLHAVWLDGVRDGVVPRPVCTVEQLGRHVDDADDARVVGRVRLSVGGEPRWEGRRHPVPHDDGRDAGLRRRRCPVVREPSRDRSVTVDAAGRANAVWTRSIDNVSDTEIRFARQ